MPAERRQRRRGEARDDEADEDELLLTCLADHQYRQEAPGSAGHGEAHREYVQPRARARAATRHDHPGGDPREEDRAGDAQPAEQHRTCHVSVQHQRRSDHDQQVESGGEPWSRQSAAAWRATMGSLLPPP